MNLQRKLAEQDLDNALADVRELATRLHPAALPFGAAWTDAEAQRRGYLALITNALQGGAHLVEHAHFRHRIVHLLLALDRWEHSTRPEAQASIPISPHSAKAD